MLFLIVFILILSFGLIFLYRYWRPVKFSIKETDFQSYNKFILVKETYHTGTKWEIIGDENGFYSLDEVKDIDLSGERLPYSEVGHRINTFLCIGDYQGLLNHEAFEKKIESYKITEWYPVYPVVRNSIWPDWMLPSNFMNKKDMKYY